MDNYTTYSGSSSDPAAAVAIVLSLLLIYTVIIVTLYIVTAIFLGRLFNKAGVPSWIAWVPVYNNWKLLQLGGQQGWWSLLMFVPIVNIAAMVFTYIGMYHVGKKLGKDDWFILLAIFVGLVWVIWLAVDDSKWDESKGAARLDTPAFPPGTSPAPIKDTTPNPPTAAPKV